MIAYVPRVAVERPTSPIYAGALGRVLHYTPPPHNDGDYRAAALCIVPDTQGAVP